MPRVAEGCWTASQVAACAGVSPSVVRRVDHELLSPPTRRGPLDAVIVQLWERLPEVAARSSLAQEAKRLITRKLPETARLVVVDNSRVKVVYRAGDVLNLWEDEPGQLLVLPIGRWVAHATEWQGSLR